jgi:uncharacterized protein (TIGR02118 family)
MFKLVFLYRRVDDEAALETFFSEEHLPLAEQMPDLIQSEVSRIRGKPGGESRFHLMYELYFPSQEAYEKAMISETGLNLIRLITPWWQAKIITWFFAESYAEQMKVRGEESADEGELEAKNEGNN